MTLLDETPILVLHDSLIVIDCTDAACDLFRCDKETLIGFLLVNLVYSDDFRGLVLLRMRLLREQGHVPPIECLYQRFDGTRFYGVAVTTSIAPDRYLVALDVKYDD